MTVRAGRSPSTEAHSEKVDGAEKSAVARPLLTIDELAELLRVPKATIYRWRSMGEGPRGYSVGRYIRFRWLDVEAWLAERADD